MMVLIMVFRMALMKVLMMVLTMAYCPSQSNPDTCLRLRVVVYLGRVVYITSTCAFVLSHPIGTLASSRVFLMKSLASAVI